MSVATREDRSAKRRQIAERMASLGSDRRPGEVDRVAHEFNVCGLTVRAACKEHRVEIPRLRGRALQRA